MSESDEREGLSFYTLDDLQELSGFDRRTIAYYVQIELLPRVGRRGRRTRYPKTFLDRLLVIRRLRNLEENGEISPLNLSEMKVILDQLSEQMIEELASGKEPLHAIDFRFGDQGKMPYISNNIINNSYLDVSKDRFTELRRARSKNYSLNNISNHANYKEVAHYKKADSIAQMFSDLDQIANNNRCSDDSSPQQWTRMEVTPNISIAVRGLDETDNSKFKRLVELLITSIG